MTVQANPFVTIKPEPQRDAKGRAQILNPVTGEIMSYRRASGFADDIENQYGLNLWKKRCLMMGLRNDPDLWDTYLKTNPGDKQAIDEIIYRAELAGGAKTAAERGTLVHSWTERLDLGQTSIDQAPADIQGDLMAYKAAMRVFKIHKVETFVVQDTIQAAGTFDRLIEHDGNLYIADIKTGAIANSLGFAAQQAIYANSVPYDFVNHQRLEWPGPVDKTRALIIHLPVGQGRCSLHWIDIREGWEDVVATARKVRELWGRRYISDFFDPSITAAALTAAIGAAPTLKVLNDIWVENRDIWTDEHTQAAAARKASLTV